MRGRTTMPRSAVLSRRISFEFEDTLPRPVLSPVPREYESWPCDSFFVLPDAVLAMDAEAFRADLRILDPVLSASLPDWSADATDKKILTNKLENGSIDSLSFVTDKENQGPQRPFTLLHNHQGLLVRASGKGTVVIGGGIVSGNEGSPARTRGDTLASIVHYSEIVAPSSNGLTCPSSSSQSSLSQNMSKSFTLGSDTPSSQKDRCSGLSYKEREERVRQLRIRQQEERQRKLEELKEHAASAQRFREQQESARRKRFDEMRNRDSERRHQVEERKKMIQQAEQDRREAVVRKNVEREQRLDLKRRQERSNAVFAFGSSTPRMLDPKESLHQDLFAARRSSSTLNVNITDSSSSVRRSSEIQDSDFSKKRAVSAHCLNRKADDMRMSTSMYEVFNWDEGEASRPKTPAESSSSAAQGHRSGNVTPGGSSSRPTSALSQTSSGGPQQVLLRTRSSPKKPRPLSIAGTVPSSADKPRDSRVQLGGCSASAASHALLNRESRTSDKRLSTGAIDGAKVQRAKSLSGSDSIATTTPAKTSKTPTRRTPAQVKAENAAKKASERSKAATKLRTTPKPTLPSPSVESKSLPSSEKKPSMGSNKTSLPKEPEKILVVSDTIKNEETLKIEIIPDSAANPELLDTNIPVTHESDATDDVAMVTEKVTITVGDVSTEEQSLTTSESTVTEIEQPESNPVPETEGTKTPVTQSTEKPVTGYASEQEYKAALAEKRRQAREVKERELELEKQKQLEEEERERKEEEEYLRLMEEQKKAEEERLKLAIGEAEKQRQLEAQKWEEEEKQKIENEKIEQQKMLEAEEKMRKEEEERQLRKSRVAAIMSRTRGAKGSPSTQSKSDAGTPLDESKTLNNSLMSESMTETLISRLSSTMTDSMIVQAIESHQSDSQKEAVGPISDTPGSYPSQFDEDNKDVDKENRSFTSISLFEDSSNFVAHVNGNIATNGSALEDSNVCTTTTSSNVDLLGSMAAVNGAAQNGTGSSRHGQERRVQLDPFAPLNSVGTHQPLMTRDPQVEMTGPATFDQIIDLSQQTKLINDGGDAPLDEKPPAVPIIAFEDNFTNMKPLEPASNVPDLLL